MHTPYKNKNELGWLDKAGKTEVFLFEKNINPVRMDLPSASENTLCSQND